ncbi:toll-like receptor 2 type-1 [Trichonephila inaurata madagascariensis]|uniref:Toll-like receptor 2 type-1 n=1 Tax=Trichonephila inaurata madagascariensis TaxID=2747483 RepID=A0A8X7C444_9ARAC|nr:toll-like receptor 2 type-1 [Trichonephila inaurata madagascariensis]
MKLQIWVCPLLKRCNVMVLSVLSFISIMSLSTLDARILTVEALHSHQEVIWCIFYNNSDSAGLDASCSSFQSNQTTLYFPSSVLRLQIQGVYNLSTESPLAPNLEQLLILDLQHNKIETVTNYMFEGLEKLSEISLASNYLHNVPFDAFKHSPLLKKIDLSNNLFISIRAVTASMTNLSKLQNLYLAKNFGITLITNQDFQPLENISLKSLDLCACAIKSIARNAFRSLTLLASLNISSNYLEEQAIESLTYSLNRENLKDFRVSKNRNMPYLSVHLLNWLRYSHVEYLDISKNLISLFSMDGFSEVRYLNLAECGIAFLPTQAFFRMTKLEVLLMNHHYLTTIDDQFIFNAKLRILDLSEYAASIYEITVKIANFAFRNLKNLEFLNLSNLPLRRGIGKHTFTGLSNLTKLNLHRCSITFINDYSFEPLSSLLSLDLSSNRIDELSNNTFFGLHKVTMINLSSNRLSFLNDSHPFELTPMLARLRINDNKIFRFPSGIFLNLHSLTSIDASDNSIEPWTDQIIPHSGNLNSLILRRNKITYFTKEMIEDLNKFEFLDLYGNLLNCSHCSTIYLKEWIESSNASFAKFSSEIDNFICHEPIELEGIDVSSANLNFLTIYCVPKEVDIIKVLYSSAISLLLVVLIAIFVWYRWHWSIRYLFFLARSRIKTHKEHVTADRYTFDCFVSYCDKDTPWVRSHLLPALETEAHKIICCLPDRDFVAGYSAVDNIAAAIEQSRTTLLILSNEYLNSDWCRFEAEIAQHKLFEDSRNGLIVILLEPILKERITKNLQYVIRTRTCVQWTNIATGQKLFWKRLRLALMSSVGKDTFTHIT